jgi:hypothetical protein
MFIYFFNDILFLLKNVIYFGDRRGRDRMGVGFATTYAIGAYHHRSCEFESRSWRGRYSIM